MLFLRAAIENEFGFIKFRQDRYTAKIIILETVRNLNRIMNTCYSGPWTQQMLLMAIAQVLSWLTLGKGLNSSIHLNRCHGNGNEQLWRDVTAAARGTSFDIHFRIIDATSMEVVLTSDCYQYTVR